MNIPWVEKYRPTIFENIVLDPVNKKIFQNVIKNKYFPNILFYGPPGTGKTTTIINLIKQYQENKNNVSVIHLNASDERGIDIIRNQINQFVNSKGFYENEMKFVILDEVDYMTKNAQLALKYLLQSNCNNVRFCLICNYISKIDSSLKEEFVCMRFNQLPKKDIIKFIKHISIEEKLNINEEIISSIQEHFNSDIRSMINYIQLNQNINNWNKHILNNLVYEKLDDLFYKQTNTKEIIKHIDNISIIYNQDKLYLIKGFINYFIRNKDNIQNISTFLNRIELLMHNNKSSIENHLLYFINIMKQYYLDVKN
jgi:DNA polymerase III delta prime subunit